LLPWEVEAFQNGHWEYPDSQVCHDIEAREAEPKGDAINAVSTFDALVPEVRDWPAGKAGCQDHREASHPNETNKRPGCPAIRRLDEEAKILVQDRVLDDEKTEIVNDDTGVQ